MATIALRYAAGHSLATLAARYAAGHSLSGVVMRYAAGHSLREPVYLRFGAGHVLMAAVTLRFRGRHDLENATAVALCFRSVHSMFSPSVDYIPAVTATAAGQSIELVSFTITANEDSYCLQCEAEVKNASTWNLCEPGASFSVSVGSQTFQFLVDARSRSRQFAEASFSITARSRASRLDKAYSGVLSQTWTNTTAKLIAQSIAGAYGFSLDWNILDWPVASFSSDAQSPLEALHTIKTEAAVLLSKADGGLAVQWLYPVTPSQYAAQAPALELSDYADITQIDDSYEAKPGYNAVRVMDDGSTSASAEVTLQEWTGPDADDPEIFPIGQRCVAAFTHPYQAINLQSNCPVSIYAEGRRYFDVTEERISVSSGTAALSYPCEEILGYEYHCADLGAVSATGKKITTATAGQTLVSVTYRTSYQRFLVETNSYKKMQVWAEVESEVDSAVNILRIVRGAGDVEAPDIIADALCTCEAIARERGRNFLDAEGYSKVLYEATTPPRGFVLPGGIARVEDVSTGETFHAKITGWELTWNEDEKSIRWDLERAI